jgi:carboxypeptidase family protein
MTMIGSNKLVRIFVLFCVVLSYMPVAFPQGQTSGAIRGRAYEMGTNAPLVGVTIKVADRETGFERTTVTGADGSYQITTLPVGRYYIEATAKDYVSDPVDDFPIRLGQTTVVQPPPFAMRRVNAPAAVQPEKPVGTNVQGSSSSGAKDTPKNPQEQLTNTINATRSGNFDTGQLVALPLPATRTFDDLAFLTAGVSDPPEAIGRILGPGVGPGVGTSGQFSVNGLRARSNNFTIDGSDNNDPDVGVRRQGFVALVPQTPESVQEFQIATLLWDSEFGRNFGSQVNAVSKAGTNSLHGQAYGFLTDSSMNAQNAFDFLGGPSGGQDPYTRTLAGFAIGAPIIRSRTQVFSSFELQNINSSVEQHFSVPTVDQRRFFNKNFDVLELRTLLSLTGGNVLTTDTGITPVGQTAFSVYPLPNNPGGPYGKSTFTQSLPADGSGTVFSFKVTQQFTSKNSLNVRYNLTDDDRTLPSVNRAINSTIDSNTRTQDVSFSLDSALTTTIVNQARFSFGRTRLDFPEFPTSPFVFNSTTTTPATVLDLTTGVESTKNLKIGTGQIGQLTITPFSSVGVDAYTFPQSRTNNTFQYADTLSYPVRNHSLKVGADIRRLQLDSSQERVFRPAIVFGSGLATRGVLDLDPAFPVPPVPPAPFRFRFDKSGVSVIEGAQLAAAGVVSSVLQTITFGEPNPKINLRSTEYNLFLNDSWRILRNVSLDYGVRYEYNSRPRDKRIEDAISLKSLPSPSRSEFLSLFPGREAQFDSLVVFFNGAVNAYSKVLDGRNQIYQRDANNFAPHFGFAWDPRSDGRMAIRGGYGIYYDAVLGAVVSQSRNVFPNEIPFNFDPSFGSFGIRGFPNISELVFNGLLPLIKNNTRNQFGGTSGLFAPLIGGLFSQNSLAGGLAFTLPEKKLRTSYAQHWHLTVERAFFGDYLASAAYVGTKGTKLTRLNTPNGGPNVAALVPIITALKFQGQTGLLSRPAIFPNPSVIATSTQLVRDFFGVADRPEAFLGPYQLFENSANSTYHSLQLEMRKRYSHGYSLTAAYTWSRAMDDVSDVFPIAGAPLLPENYRNVKLEHANANFDMRHRFAASLIWDLPFHRNSSPGAGRILGGWQIGSVFRAHTGQPFTLNLPVDANLDGNLTDRPSTTRGLTFFDGHGSQKISSGNQPLTNFFSLGKDGFVERNSVRADSFVNVDLALSKTFKFNESQNLQFRSECFNLLNRANYGIPIRIIGAPGFGSSVDTVNAARMFQFALKYSF